jgi:hypothetical protein
VRQEGWHGGACCGDADEKKERGEGQGQHACSAAGIPCCSTPGSLFPGSLADSLAPAPPQQVLPCPSQRLMSTHPLQAAFHNQPVFHDLKRCKRLLMTYFVNCALLSRTNILESGHQFRGMKKKNAVCFLLLSVLSLLVYI